MFYIQRYQAEERSNANGVDRMIRGDYMGSSEFESGSIQQSWKYLRQERIKLYEHTVQSKGGFAARVKFYVITTELGFEQFKEGIDRHLDGTRVGRLAKEWTSLWEKFNTKPRPERMPDAWFAVDGFVSNNTWGDDNKLITPAPPIFFTANHALARRVFFELNRKDYTFDNNELRIGDMVQVPDSTLDLKVCGLNEDDTISVKGKYAKARKFDSRDVYQASFIKQLMEQNYVGE